MVKDNDPNMSGKVVKALATAMEPSLRDVQYGFNDSLCAPKELYRNCLVSEYGIIAQATLADIKFSLKARPSEDGVTDELIDLAFFESDFVEVEGEAADHLIKMAVHDKI